MSEDKKKLEVVFAPGCFDGFDGTQEELDALIAEINEMVETGEIFDKAQMLDEDDPDYEAIRQKLLDGANGIDTRTLQ